MSQNNKEHRIHIIENSPKQVSKHVSGCTKDFKLNKHSTIPLSPNIV
jgi:hypothetical protein